MTIDQINDLNQIKNSFDKKTLWKIVKGALISATGVIALALLDILGQIKFSDTYVTMIVAWFVPNAVNIIKEYLKGN